MAVQDFNHKDADERWWLRGWRQLRRVKRVVLADAGEGRGGRQKEKERAPVDPAHHQGKHARCTAQTSTSLAPLGLYSEAILSEGDILRMVDQWVRKTKVDMGVPLLLPVLLLVGHQQLGHVEADAVAEAASSQVPLESDHYQTKGESIYQIEMPSHLPIFWTRHLVENCQTGVSWKLIDCIQSQAGIRSKYLQDL